MKRQKHHQKCVLFFPKISLNNLDYHSLQEEEFKLEGRSADLQEWRWLYGF